MDSLMFAINQSARAHGAKRVKWVRVRIGAHCHLSAAHLQHHYDEAAAGTVAEGAQLEIIQDDNETSPHADIVVLDSLEIETD